MLTERADEELANDLIDACRSSRFDHLESLLSQYSRKMPTSTLPTPQFLLQTAAKNGHAGVIRQVFESLPKSSGHARHPWDPAIPAGIYTSQIPKKWRIYEDGVIISALEGTDPLPVFKLFLEYGMEPDHNLDRAINTTAFAIAGGKVDLVRFFLSKGAKPSGRYLQPEDTYLGSAARQHDPGMLELLLENGAELKGSQALRQAVQNGQVENAKILVALGEDVNEKYTRWNYVDRKEEVWGTPLHWAVMGTPLERQDRQASKADTVRYLLSVGAQADGVDGLGKMPRDIARENGEDDIVDVFTKCGTEG